MNNILYIAPQDSLPYTDGGKIGLFFPLKEFAKKYSVYCAFPVKKITDDTVSKYGQYNVHACPFEMNLDDNYKIYPKTLFSNLSFKFYKYYNKEFLKNLYAIVEKNNIDTVWVCHAQMAKYATELKKQYPKLKIYLREHNIEYKLVKQYIYSQKNFLMKLIAYFEYLKTKNYEINLWKQFDKVFFISDTDLKTAQKYNEKIDISNLVYDGMEQSDFDTETDTENNSFIFTGSLQSFQNENNLKYFIKNIWYPFKKKEPDAKLYLTGNKDEFLLKKLNMKKEELEKLNIINLGFVDDIKKTILSKEFVVSPTLYGSGIRLKVLEALSLKKVVFVSDIDYEMANCFKDMENIVHYKNADDFHKKYSRVKSENTYSKIAENGHLLIDKYFNWEKYAEKVSKEITKNEN